MENSLERVYYDSVKGLNEDVINDGDIWYTYILNLPVLQQVVYTVVLFHSQVENGGLHQYFFNSYGQFAFLTLNNLKLIGADKRHDLLDAALNLINDKNVKENIFRKQIFRRELKIISEFDKELIDHLNKLDSEYYEVEDENIEELLEKYIHNAE